MKIGNIIASIIMVGFILLGAMVCMGTVGSIPYEYGAYKTFDTTEDALEFQEIVILEAQKHGAKVLKANITITSPPTLHYRVQMPDKTSFTYGNSWMSFWVCYLLQFFMAIFLLSMGYIGIKRIWVNKCQEVNEQ